MIPDHQQSFGLCTGSRRDQDFFLFRLLMSFFYGWLRRLSAKTNLPIEKAWVAIHVIDWSSSSVLGVAQFMKRSQIRTGTLRVTKTSVDAERKKVRRRRLMPKL